MKKLIKKAIVTKMNVSLASSIQRLEESIKDVKFVRSDMRQTIKDLLKGTLDNSSVCAKLERMADAKRLAEYVGDQVILTLYQLETLDEGSISEMAKALRIRKAAIEAIHYYFKNNKAISLPGTNELMARKIADISGFDTIDLPE